MTTKQMKSEMNYAISMGILTRMYERGMLTDRQYAKAKRKLSRIYMPPVSGLLSQNP